MALTERTEEKLEILNNGVIQVQTARIILDNNVEIAKTYHRSVVDVDGDTTGQSDRLKAIAPSIWTQSVKDARIAEKAANQIG